MARRKGFLGRIISRVFRAIRTEEREPPTPPAPEPIRVPPTPGINAIRQRVLDHMVAVLPLVKIGPTRDRIRLMTPDELAWALRATADQLKHRARQDADRLHPVKHIPINPFWYG